MVRTDNIYNGFLYNISNERGKTKGFLAGSLHHVADKKFKISKNLKNAFKQSKTLAVECDIVKHQEALTRKVRMMDSQVLLKMAITLSKMKVFEGIDQKFHKKAIKKGMPIKELEKIDEHMNAVTNLISHMQGGSENTPEVFKTLNQAYKKGEKKVLMKVIEEGMSELAKEKFLFGRNRNMASKIDALLNKDSMPFVVVGAAHLFGKDQGLVALLRNQGWKVTRIK